MAHSPGSPEPAPPAHVLNHMSRVFQVMASPDRLRALASILQAPQTTRSLATLLGTDTEPAALQVIKPLRAWGLIKGRRVKGRLVFEADSERYAPLYSTLSHVLAETYASLGAALGLDHTSSTPPGLPGGNRIPTVQESR